MDSESGVTKFTRKFFWIPIKNREIPRKMPDFTRPYRSPKIQKILFSRIQPSETLEIVGSFLFKISSPNVGCQKLAWQ